MSRADFKRSRLCAPDELDDMSTEQWATLLQHSSKSTFTSTPASAEPEPVVEQKSIINAMENDETICIAGSEAHKQFAFVRLDLRGGGARIKKETPNHGQLFDDEDSEASGEEESLPAPISLLERLKPSEYYQKFVARTPQQCAEELAAPQRSEAWLEARKLCITASQFGAAVGESQYQTPDGLVLEKLWNTFQGNAATEWGTTHEEDAKVSFLSWFKGYAEGLNYENVRFVEENLMKFDAEPWMAVSPDGIIQYTHEGVEHTDLVEFKCPAYLRNTVTHPYAKYKRNTPTYYYAQTQGIMGYINAHHPDWKMNQCWFVVWQPHQTWISLQHFDEAYYESLHSKLETWYFKKLLPALTHKHNNLLSIGSAVPIEPIELQS
jgi:putative phage-type endonuclease